MPEVHRTIDSFRGVLDGARAAGRTVGATPTMGYLHEGHGSLMRRATADNDLSVATIFVNPLQFAADEDLSTYPRDEERDLALADDCGVTHVLAPSVEEMYPKPILTAVRVDEITTRFEGASRPEHFGGVATVVAKLFSIFGPCRAYFGEKDYQQLAVVRRMAFDLSMPVEVVGCPTVREPDGLAMSSRNVYLTDAQRAAAPALYRGLQAGQRAATEPGATVESVERAVTDEIDAEDEGEVDYVALVDAETLEPATEVGGAQRLLVTVRFGTTRLLDNLAVPG